MSGVVRFFAYAFIYVDIYINLQHLYIAYCPVLYTFLPRRYVFPICLSVFSSACLFVCPFVTLASPEHCQKR